MSNTDDAIVSPPFCIDQRSSAVETHVFSPFSLWLTLRSGHADHSPFHLLPLGFRTSFHAEPFFGHERHVKTAFHVLPKFLNCMGFVWVFVAALTSVLRSEPFDGRTGIQLNGQLASMAQRRKQGILPSNGTPRKTQGGLPSFPGRILCRQSSEGIRSFCRLRRKRLDRLQHLR